MLDFKKYKKRPYLMITFLKTPTKNDQKNGWKLFEDMAIKDKLDNKSLINSNLIIDILNVEIVKNTFLTKSNDEILDHYMSVYVDKIKQAVTTWLQANFDDTTIGELEKYLEEFPTNAHR